MALINDNLVSFWKFSESSGDAADSVGSNTLTNVGTVTYTAGLMNNCIDLGSGNVGKWMKKLTNIGITGGAISMSVWVKLDAEIAANQWDFIGQCDSGTNVLNLIRYEFNGGTKRLNFLRVRSGTGTDNFTSNLTMGTTNWHHIVYTYDGSTVTGYVDGSSVGTVASTGNGTSGETQSFVTVGSGDGLPSNLASAKFDALGIWSRVLTAAEVTLLYQGGVGVEVFIPVSVLSVASTLNSTAQTIEVLPSVLTFASSINSTTVKKAPSYISKHTSSSTYQHKS